MFFSRTSKIYDIFSNREWKAARKMWQVDVQVKRTLPRRVVRELNWTVSAPPPSQKNKRPLPMKSKPFSAIRYPNRVHFPNKIPPRSSTFLRHDRLSFFFFLVSPRVLHAARHIFFPRCCSTFYPRLLFFRESGKRRETERREPTKERGR